jgi:phosphate-selective porin
MSSRWLLSLVVAALLGPRAAAGQTPGAGSPPVGDAKAQTLAAVYSDGFVLRSGDARHELRLAASTQLDSRAYPGTSGAPDSFDIRRARLDLAAKLLGFMDLRIQAALEDSPYIRNAFLDVAIHRALHLRAGQMKVPFSTQWLTLDNQVDFMERATAEPLYPFIDRGGLVWGGLLGDRVFYHVGIFDGVGVDLDAPKGDIDHRKEVAYRLFLQPLRRIGPRWLHGLYLVGQGTWGGMSIPTRRFETRGLVAPDFESLVFRWRTEQLLGSNGRNVDQIGATIDSQTRWGAEVHYLLGPLTLSAEWAMVSYDDITIYHDLMQGATRLRHDVVSGAVDGTIHSVSGFVSVFLTGEKKHLDNFGYRQPVPLRSIARGQKGYGAWEVLARFSRTWVPRKHHAGMFDTTKVAGYALADNTGIKGPLPAEGASVNAAVIDGARLMYEVTLGVNWTLNYHARVMLDYGYLIAPHYAEEAGGAGSQGLISGGNSESADVIAKNKNIKSEHEVGLRLIFRI